MMGRLGGRNKNAPEGAFLLGHWRKRSPLVIKLRNGKPGMVLISADRYFGPRSQGKRQAGQDIGYRWHAEGQLGAESGRPV